MTPQQSAWIRERIAEGVRRHTELVAKRESLADWPRSAWDDPPALLVYATDAMFAYYLGADGSVYCYDMDRFRQELDPVADPMTIREVHAKAAELFPALAGLSSA